MDTLIENESEKKIICNAKYSNISILEEIIKCKSKKGKTKIDKEIPGGIIIGGIETICGALLWITPFRAVGAGMMVDGVRRMLNATEEESKKNEKNDKNNEKKSDDSKEKSTYYNNRKK